MKEGHRLAILAEELHDQWERGEGAELPRVGRDDAGAIARMLHAEMDKGTEARAQFAQVNQLTIACERGCAACCENVVFAFEAEAVAVAQWLCEAGNEDARAWFEESYPRWREAAGDMPERAAAAIAVNRRKPFDDALKEVLNARLMCAFNREGSCTVYPVRPNYCRNCHALDTAEHCAADSEESPTAIQFDPLETFVRRSRPLAQALHVALGRERGVPAPLCEAVHRLLRAGDARRLRDKEMSAKVGRNEPCPCGSGLKYKRCCGAE